jgi:hypothetical protein
VSIEGVILRELLLRDINDTRYPVQAAVSVIGTFCAEGVRTNVGRCVTHFPHASARPKRRHAPLGAARLDKNDVEYDFIERVGPFQKGHKLQFRDSIGFGPRPQRLRARYNGRNGESKRDEKDHCATVGLSKRVVSGWQKHG